MKKLLLFILCALLLLSLTGCYFPADLLPRRQIKEKPPVRDPNEMYTETVEDGRLVGTIHAICGDDMIRIHLYEEYHAEFGETVYVRLPQGENTERLYNGDEVTITFETIERSNNPDDPPILAATYMDVCAPCAKPVIYLYPETPTEVSVTLTLNGRLTCTYPDYEEGWDNFTAHPDGTLIFPDGKEYYCLYWEGMQVADWDFSQGFCIKGEDTAAFLEWALAEQGLTAREANEFIIYWLPLMQENPYNVIAFQTDAYTDGAVLEITPAPDSTIRIMMAYYPSDEAVEIAPQTFETPARDGFTVVEWGGSPVRKP